MLDPTAIFAEYLDLTPLRGRRSGLIKCIFHDDPTPSLSVNLDALVFHCFGCHAQGGYKAFEARVKGYTPGTDTSPTVEESAVLAGLRLAKGQPWTDEVVWRANELADWVRNTRRWVAEVRAQASDDLDSWDLLARAAYLETVANNVECMAFGHP